MISIIKYIRFIVLFLALIVLYNCKQAHPINVRPTDNAKAVKALLSPEKATPTDNLISDKTFVAKLKYNFLLKQRIRYGTGKYDTLHYLEVWHNGLKIFTDASDTAEVYNFESKPYPILNKLQFDIFELLIEFDNGPSKDQVTFLRIENDKVVRKEILPTFDGKPDNIGGNLIYHGIADYGEVWDENGKTYTTYNPQIYFRFTPDGLQLDRALTIFKRKQKYGRFEGFTYHGIIGYPSDYRGNITDTTAKSVLRRPTD